MQSYPNIFQIRFHFVKYLQSYVSLLSKLNALGLCCNAVIKLLPGIPASHTGAFFANLPAQFQILLPARVRGLCTWFPYSHAKPGWSSWQLPLAWASLGHSYYLESEPLDGRALYLAVSDTLALDNQTVIFKTKLRAAFNETLQDVHPREEKDN